jgi:hypothetical protein
MPEAPGNGSTTGQPPSWSHDCTCDRQGHSGEKWLMPAPRKGRWWRCCVCCIRDEDTATSSIRVSQDADDEFRQQISNPGRIITYQHQLSSNNTQSQDSYGQGVYSVLNNSIEHRQAPKCSQKDCPIAWNITYFEAKRSWQNLADFYRKTEGIWDTIWCIMPVHGCLPAWIRFANPPTSAKSTIASARWLDGQDGYGNSISHCDGIFHGEIDRQSVSSWSKGITLLLPLASRYAYTMITRTFDNTQVWGFQCPRTKFSANLDSVLTARKLESEQFQFEYRERACEIEHKGAQSCRAASRYESNL